MRALKTALFGTPAPRERRTTAKIAADKAAHQNGNRQAAIDKSPARPPGILLTPGTGTTRRKRVSFGHDVKQGSGGPARTSTTGLPEDVSSKIPTPWVDGDAEMNPSRPKTKLQQAMENSRGIKMLQEGSSERDVASSTKEPEDAWEEVDDDSEFEADVTTDLNEPHSRSGKYWKSYFETYHTDAKAEMEKLVKYKHLAKSYAKMKDAEALELNEKLKEEQGKVKAMEDKVAEMSRHAALATRQKGGKCDPQLMDELEKQTELATEYKKQVEELESLLQVGVEETGDGRQRQRRVASPRTHRTLIETHRELRRARSQVRELEKLQEERDRLKSELRFAEQRATKLFEENRKLTGELSKSTSRIQELEKRLEDSNGLYGKLKDDAKARYLEAQQVLQKKNEMISDLQQEINSLKSDGGDLKRPSRSARTKSFDGKLTAPKISDSTDEGGARVLKEIREIKRTKSHRGLTTAPAADARQRERHSADNFKRTSYEDDTLATSRALREKRIEADLGSSKGVTALAIRDNLQDSQSSLSSGRSAHSREDQPRPGRTIRPSRSTYAATPAERASRDLLSNNRASRTSSTSLDQRPESRTQPPPTITRLLSRDSDSDAAPEIDLVQSRFARLGGRPANAPNTSAVWSTAMNTSRTTLPADRHAAAVARLQRKRVEREMQRDLVKMDKENFGDY